MNISEDEVKKNCIGLDIYKARIRIQNMYPELEDGDIDMMFVESTVKRFTVLDCGFGKYGCAVVFYVASANPITHLPSNYQDNEFLRGFLMIFQHVYNETSIKLDNMHENFRPMECRADFLPLLADWFGVNLDLLGGEDEIRKYLQFAIPLYRWRGTALGIKACLYIVTGIVPQIIEGSLPYGGMEISDYTEIQNDLFDKDGSTGLFTVYFPVYSEQMAEGLKRRIVEILRSEKPVHTRCCLCFRKKEKTGNRKTVLDKTDNSWISGGKIV